MNESKKNPKKTKSKGNLLSIVVVVLIGINIFFIYKVDQINKIVTEQNKIIETIQSNQAEGDLYLKDELYNLNLMIRQSYPTVTDVNNSLDNAVQELEQKIFIAGIDTDTKIARIYGASGLENKLTLYQLNNCIERISDYLETLDNYNDYNPNWTGKNYNC